MKVETEELPNSEVALSFEVEPVRLERALDAAARKLAQRVNIPGFRRGKAPRALVERVLGKESVLEEALEQLLPEAYREAASQRQIRGLTEPEFDVESVSPLRARATVVVPPAVTLGDYRSIRYDPPSPAVTAEQVEAALEQLRDRHAEWMPVDRVAEMGDRLLMGVAGECEGRTIVEQSGTDYLLEPGRTSPVPGFAESVLGMSADEERAFDLAVPEDHEHRDIAGKVVHFTVAAKEVQAKELPELDDYFASTVGSYVSLDELRSKVEADLLEEAQAAAEQQTQREVVAEALAVSSISLPDKLLDHEMQRARDRLSRNLDTYRITTQQYNRLLGRTDAEMEESLRTRMENDLRQGFVLQAIAAEEGLTVTEEEVDTRILAMVQADGGDSRSGARISREPTIRDRVRASLLEERGAQWLVEHATRPEGGSRQEEEP